MSNGVGTVGALKITLGLESLRFEQGMKTANQRLAALNSEFKAISAGAAKFDNSLDTLRSRADVLTRTMNVHRAKVEELRKQYEASKATKGEDAEETVKLAATYNRAVAAMNNTEQQLRNVNRQIQDQTNGFKQLEHEVKLSTDSIDRQVRVLESGFAAATAGIRDFGSETEDLRQREQHLSQTLTLQQRQVQELTRLHEEAARAKGTDARETQEIEIRLNQARQAMRTTERQLGDTTRDIEQQSNAWNVLSRRIESASTSLQEHGARLKDVGQGLTTAVTLPLVGFAVAVGKAANDFDASSGRIEARLGVTKKRAEELNNVAQDIWKSGFGEGVQEVADAVALVGNNLKGISDKELKEVTKSALFLSQAFDADINDSTKTASALMKNFGIDATKAFDIITTGFQQGGDYSGELLDTLNEYSVQFASIGLSAEQFLSILIKGSQAGAFNLDKVGDAVKEFNIRAQDGSKTTAQGFKAIGLDAEKMGQAIAKGGAEGQKAFVATVTALASIKDPLKQNQAGVALFGTQWEDVRKKVILAMSDAVKNVQKVDGATKKASDAIQDNFGTRLQKVWRDFQSDLKPVGENLLKIAERDLPKLANTLEKVTGAFANMSPEAQKMVLTLGGIATAAGPVLMGIGSITTGIGTLIKGVMPLIRFLGAGEGLAGTLALLTGPVGLTVAGLGLLAGATYLTVKATEKAKEVNLDHAKSLIDQQKSLEDLTTRYEALRDKNKLSNDELLKFRDIQDKLKTAGSAKEVEELTKQADELRKKSGLSNDELNEMLGLNDKLIEKVPTAGKVISDQGNSILDNTKDLHEANNALREKIALELEVQKTKANAKLDEDIRNQVKAVEEYKAKYQELRDAQNEAHEKEIELGDLKQKQQDVYAEGQKRIGDAMNDDIQLLEFQVDRQNKKVEAVAGEVQEKEKSVEKSDEELAKVQKIYDELINLQLAQAGINEKGTEGIAQLDTITKKTQDRINDLNLIKEKHGGLNEEQQKELDKLTEALGIYNTTKGEIQNIQQEQSSVNKKIDDGTAKAKDMNTNLSKDVNKNVNVDDHGKAKQITDESSKGANKNVNVSDGGKAKEIHAEAEKSASKGITLRLLNHLSDLLPPSISVSVKLIGKLIKGMFASGTRNAPEGLSLVGEEGPELVHLPQGAKVIPNRDTEAILRNWNIPMMAKGGVALTSGMAYVGEKGRELVDLRGAVTSPYSGATSHSSRGDTYVTVNSLQAVMDENELARTLQRLEVLYGR